MWIVVLGALSAFFAAFGIGANDVANAYATSVGSKALTVKQVRSAASKLPPSTLTLAFPTPAPHVCAALLAPFLRPRHPTPQACVLAVIFEFLGATFLGGTVVKTIRKGIADTDYFENDPALLMWGCFCVITCVGIWLLVMSRFEIPVSTTHSCVGGMIGMAIAAYGSDAVKWAPPSDSSSHSIC